MHYCHDFLMRIDGIIGIRKQQHRSHIGGIHHRGLLICESKRDAGRQPRFRCVSGLDPCPQSDANSVRNRVRGPDRREQHSESGRHGGRVSAPGREILVTDNDSDPRARGQPKSGHRGAPEETDQADTP